MIPKLIINIDSKIREQYCENLIIELGFKKNHPDLMWFGMEEKLGMEQTKKIKEFLNLKPYQSAGQIIVIIAAENLTTDAQNALLKTLEEHAAGVNLILCCADENKLLPTLTSRCQITYLNSNSADQTDLEKFYIKIEELQATPIENRFQLIEKVENKDLFLKVLTSYFRNQLLTGKKQQNIYVSFLKHLIEAEKMALSNVNIRAILEYLMLKLPKK